MCGRSACTLDPASIRDYVAKRLQQALVPFVNAQSFTPHFNAGPTTLLPILQMQQALKREENNNITTEQNTTYFLECMHWGILSSHISDPVEAKKWASNMINARSESVFEKPSFKHLIRKKRCALVINGYYEWHVTKTEQKQPFYIQAVKKKMLILAAIFDTSPIDNQHSFAVITTTSKGSDVETVHDRMPVLLQTRADVDKWLSPATTEAELQKMMQPAPLGSLVYKRVSDYVNSTKNEGPKCIESLTSVQEREGLNRFFKKKEPPAKRIKLEHQE